MMPGQAEVIGKVWGVLLIEYQDPIVLRMIQDDVACCEDHGHVRSITRYAHAGTRWDSIHRKSKWMSRFYGVELPG